MNKLCSGFVITFKDGYSKGIQNDIQRLKAAIGYQTDVPLFFIPPYQDKI